MKTLSLSDITFLANRTYWSGAYSMETPEKFRWCSSKNLEANLSNLKWKNEQPKFVPEGCLSVHFPFIPRIIIKANSSAVTNITSPVPGDLFCGFENILYILIEFR